MKLLFAGGGGGGVRYPCASLCTAVLDIPRSLIGPLFLCLPISTPFPPLLSLPLLSLTLPSPSCILGSCCVVGGPRPVVPDAVPPHPARDRLGGVQSHVGARGGQRLPLRVRRGLCFLGLPPLFCPPVSSSRGILSCFELSCESSGLVSSSRKQEGVGIVGRTLFGLSCASRTDFVFRESENVQSQTLGVAWSSPEPPQNPPLRQNLKGVCSPAGLRFIHSSLLNKICT